MVLTFLLLPVIARIILQFNRLQDSPLDGIFMWRLFAIYQPFTVGKRGISVRMIKLVN